MLKIRRECCDVLSNVIFLNARDDNFKVFGLLDTFVCLFLGNNQLKMFVFEENVSFDLEECWILSNKGKIFWKPFLYGVY